VLGTPDLALAYQDTVDLVAFAGCFQNDEAVGVDYVVTVGYGETGVDWGKMDIHVVEIAVLEMEGTSDFVVHNHTDFLLDQAGHFQRTC